MTLTRESLDNDETEVNYFLISKINGLGIYQHYHNSTSVRQFNEILECLVFKRKMAVLAKKTKDLNDDKEKKLRKKFKVEVNFSAIYEKGGLKKVLEEFDRIKSFQYTFAELEDDVRANVPASTFAYRKTECVVYGDGPVADIGRAIDTFVKNRSLRGGKIKVLNASNRLKTVDIFDNMINFGEQEYDGFLRECSIFCVSQVFINLCGHPVDLQSGWLAETMSGSSSAPDVTSAQLLLTYPRTVA